jgi:hypothetical protein
MAQRNSFDAELATWDLNAAKISADIAANKIALETVFQGISSRLPRVRFGCSKALLLLSGKHPDLLYEKIDRFVRLLDSENRILKWTAIAILGNLAAVDAGRRLKSLQRRLYDCLDCGELITANHAIAALGKIAQAYPDERKRITARLLGIEHKKFDTSECRNIAIGKVILAIETFLDPAKPGKSALDFVRRQMNNPRKATAGKAKAFIRKYRLRTA